MLSIKLQTEQQPIVRYYSQLRRVNLSTQRLISLPAAVGDYPLSGGLPPYGVNSHILTALSPYSDSSLSSPVIYGFVKCQTDPFHITAYGRFFNRTPQRRSDGTVNTGQRVTLH